jgi:hypothetical protein
MHHAKARPSRPHAMPDNLKYQRSVTRIAGQVIIDKTADGQPLCVSLDDLAALEAARIQLEQELAAIRDRLDRLPSRHYS